MAVADTVPESPNPWLVLVVGSIAVFAAALTLLWLDGLPAPTKAGVAQGLAFGFGGLVGATELASRYRDAPFVAVRTPAALAYVAVNALVSGIGFWMLQTGRLSLDIKLFGNHQALNNIVVAGFGGMALFRSSFFNVRIKDSTVAVGPAAALQVILRTADEACDRHMAKRRTFAVKEIMTGVTFLRARAILPDHCFALMQNVATEDKNQLSQALVVLEGKKNVVDQAKAHELGLLLMNIVGEQVLRCAVGTLGERIRGPVPDEPRVLGHVPSLNLADLPALRELCLETAPSADRLPADWLTMPAGVQAEAQKLLIALSRLRAAFGPETTEQAINALLATRASEKVETPTTLDDFSPSPAPQPAPPPNPPPLPDR